MVLACQGRDLHLELKLIQNATPLSHFCAFDFCGSSVCSLSGCAAHFPWFTQNPARVPAEQLPESGVKDQELPSNSKMYIPVNSAQRWGLPWFGGFSFRDCLPGLPGKMKFLSNVLAPLTKPARQREMEVQDECSPPGQTHYGLTLSLLDFSTTSRSLKFMTYFLLC